MFENKKIEKLDDFFLESKNRKERGIYFYRINGWTKEIEVFLKRYYEQARMTGVVIDGRIPNPSEKNLSYYGEMQGIHFTLSKAFIETSLKSWLPRLNMYQRTNIVNALHDTLIKMQQQGKNENMLKNAYIKYMCWMYYHFEQILSRLGEEKIPKILYGGSIGENELKLITILARAGCDVVLVQYEGDEGYKKLDPLSNLSYSYEVNQIQPFSATFNLAYLRNELERKRAMEQLYGTAPELKPCTNVWIKGTGFGDLMVEVKERGKDKTFFYNCFYRIRGVEDKTTYLNDLYQLKNKLERSGRNIVIIEKNIEVPTMEELNEIKRASYTHLQQLMRDLVRYIQYPANKELEKLLKKAFIDRLLEEAEEEKNQINRLMNKAIYLICWLKRYQKELFKEWKSSDVGCFFYLGGCNTKYEVMFLKFLATLPVDVVLLQPNLKTPCQLEDNILYEISYEESLAVEVFPRSDTKLTMGTTAYHAETELNTLLYQDSGLYKNQQYQKANAITLQTMYEELYILWDQELKYRENFSVTAEVVNLPVLYAKVSGVKDSLTQPYWDQIQTLYTEDTLLITKAPYIESTTPNPMKAYSSEFFRNGKLRREQIKKHKQYPYSFLREDTQEHILDKLELLINKKTIKGTFENGTEYTIIATILNIDAELLRMIQKFDFTKKNPKLIYINTSETMISLEDTILTAFLNLIGFDVVFFVPTGYQSIERYFNTNQLKEHQIGTYMYDLQVPNIQRGGSSTSTSWYKKIFKRGE